MAFTNPLAEKLSKLSVSHSQDRKAWDTYIDIVCCEERQSFIKCDFIPEVVAVLGERNSRGQPLIYVILRFCKIYVVQRAALLVHQKELLDLQTPDGSTPLIGLLFQQGQSLDDSTLGFFARVVGRERWFKTNNAGESADWLAQTHGKKKITF